MFKYLSSLFFVCVKNLLLCMLFNNRFWHWLFPLLCLVTLRKEHQLSKMNWISGCSTVGNICLLLSIVTCHSINLHLKETLLRNHLFKFIHWMYFSYLCVIFIYLYSLCCCKGICITREDITLLRVNVVYLIT